MANDESPLFRDIFFSSTAPMADVNDDSLLDGNLINVGSEFAVSVHTIASLSLALIVQVRITTI